LGAGGIQVDSDTESKVAAMIKMMGLFRRNWIGLEILLASICFFFKKKKIFLK
jgi:hypothetical protein